MSTQVSDAPGPDDEPARPTRRLEQIDQRPRVSHDRTRELILALGDPNHPEHANAVGELVAMGSSVVGALGAALSQDRPWLTSYRAAEALAQIGDGRASGALIGALRHPNSNVRWSAVRALAEVGDTRTLWALRKVAHDDRGKTSWGESVADTAQLALDRLQSRSALLRFTEPVKTALVFVAMFAAVLFAAQRVQAVVSELRRSVEPPVVAAGVGVASTATAEPGAEPVLDATATPEPTSSVLTTATSAAGITGSVSAASGNVRSSPRLGDNVIGIVNQGDDLIFLGVSGDWYLVELGKNTSANSRIKGGKGWVSRVVVNEPSSLPPRVAATAQP